MDKRIVKLLKATLAAALIGAIPCIADASTIAAAAHVAAAVPH